MVTYTIPISPFSDVAGPSIVRSNPASNISGVLGSISDILVLFDYVVFFSDIPLGVVEHLVSNLERFVLRILLALNGEEIFPPVLIPNDG